MAAEITTAELEKLIKEVPEGTPAKRIRVADRLFLEVRRPGVGPAKCSFVLRYTHGKNDKGESKKQSLGLGSYFPKGTAGVGGMGLSDACKAATAKLAEIDKGIQPVKAKRELIAKDTADRNARLSLETRTVRAAAEQWHEATKGKLTSDKYRDQRWRRVEEYLGQIGGIPVASLTVADVADTFTKLGAKDRAETFRRSSADLEKAVEYAASQGWYDGINPVTRARKGLDKPQQVGRRAFMPDRLPEFSKAMHGVDSALLYPVTAHLLRMLTLTAARTKEVRELKWSEVEGLDTDTVTVHVPSDRMKKRRPWSIPLSSQAADLLRDIRRWQGAAGAGLKGVEAGFVFVRLQGNYKGRLCSENAVNDLLDAMGWHGEVVGHGLRKVFSTVTHDSWPYHGANRTEAVEFSLAHVHKDKVRGTYDQNDYIAQRRELLQWWAGHLDLLRQPQSSNVVPMRAAQG